jgi:hypothetical protein
MTVYQGKVTIWATSFIGSGFTNYSVDGTNDWSIDLTNDYALNIGPSGSIPSLLVSFGKVTIFAHSFLTLTPTIVTLNAINQNYAPEDTLTLWCEGDDPDHQNVDQDEWYATLSKFKWSDLGQGGVFKGFVITSPLGGMAVLNEDPQYHVSTVGIDIITPFPKWILPSDEWQMHIPLGTDYNSVVYTPNYFRQSTLLSAFMKDMRKFVVSESTYLTQRAGDLRRWDRMPPDFLGPFIETVGCYLNISLLDNESRRRLAYEWKEFLLYAGTQYFIDFLAYVYDTHLYVDATWTNDYRDFVLPGGLCHLGRDPSRPGTLKLIGDEYFCVSNDGHTVDTGYYPTNHVVVTYDLNKFDIYDEEIYGLLLDTFYKLASVPLVLQAFLGRYREPMNMYLIIADHTTHNYVDHSAPVVVADMTLFIKMFDHRYRHYESHSAPIQLNYPYIYMVMVDYRHEEFSDYSPFIVI